MEVDWAHMAFANMTDDKDPNQGHSATQCLIGGSPMKEMSNTSPPTNSNIVIDVDNGEDSLDLENSGMDWHQ